MGSSEEGSSIEGPGIAAEVVLDDFFGRFLFFEAPLVGDRDNWGAGSGPVAVGADDVEGPASFSAGVDA